MPTLTVTLPAGDLAKRIADLEARVAALEPVIYTVTGSYSDPGHPSFIFVEVQIPLSEAQNFTTIAFAYDSSIIYTIDSVGSHHDSTKSDQVIFKLPLPENTDPNDVHEANIVGSTIITT
jgi:hypothetical protein